MDKKDLIMRGYDWSYETREEDGQGIIEGHPVVYDQLTDLGYFDEIIEKGALDKTDLRDVRLCLNHDTSVVYARSRSNTPESTMRIWVEEDGLHFRANLDMENPLSRAYYSMIERRDIDKMSFMFSVRGDRWVDLDNEHPTRYITDIGSIVEISAVTFPAYDSTEIQARDKAALESARADLERARQASRTSLERDLELLKAKTKILAGRTKR